MDIFLYILLHNIAPIVLIIAIGFVLGRIFDLNVQTLSKLNFYVYVPIFTFMQIYTTELSLQYVSVFVFAVLLLAANLFVSWLIAKTRRYEESMKNAFMNAVMFYNSGNIGVPRITLVFSSAPFLVGGEAPFLAAAMAAQIVVLVVQNITTNTIGFYNAGKKSMTVRDSVASILKMPTVYAIPLAFLFKYAVPYDLHEFPLWPGLEYLRDGLISIALLTLGAQLAKTKLAWGGVEVGIVNAVRLLGGPLLAIPLLIALRLDGVLAQALMISSAVTTALNTALIAGERDNQQEFASQAVLGSTLLSPITLTLVVYVSRIIFPV